jgi:hypothetical protein
MGWSGLLAAEARAGLEMVKSQFAQEVIDGKTYWFAPVEPSPKGVAPLARLLPAYDEYTIAYKDHSAVLDLQYLDQIIAGSGIAIIIDGQIVGTWRRTFKKGIALIALNPFRLLTEVENGAITKAVQQYGAFLEMPVLLEWV